MCFEGSFKGLMFMNGAVVSFVICVNGNPTTSQPASTSWADWRVPDLFSRYTLAESGPADA